MHVTWIASILFWWKHAIVVWEFRFIIFLFLISCRLFLVFINSFFVSFIFLLFLRPSRFFLRLFASCFTSSSLSLRCLLWRRWALKFCWPFNRELGPGRDVGPLRAPCDHEISRTSDTDLVWSFVFHSRCKHMLCCSLSCICHITFNLYHLFSVQACHDTWGHIVLVGLLFMWNPVRFDCSSSH